jgi:hypothetical protein
MSVVMQSDAVRRLVIKTFVDLGTEHSALWDLEETVSIDEGRVVARSYLLDRLFAMWLIEVGIIQFYDCEGNMLRTVSLYDPIDARMAA